MPSLRWEGGRKRASEGEGRLHGYSMGRRDWLTPTIGRPVVEREKLRRDTRGRRSAGLGGESAANKVWGGGAYIGANLDVHCHIQGGGKKGLVRKWLFWRGSSHQAACEGDKFEREIYPDCAENDSIGGGERNFRKGRKRALGRVRLCSQKVPGEGRVSFLAGTEGKNRGGGSACERGWLLGVGRRCSSSL